MIAAATIAALGCSVSHRGEDTWDATVPADDGADSDADGAVEPGCLPRSTAADVAAFEEWTRRLYCEVLAECEEGLRWPDIESCMRYDPFAWAQTSKEHRRSRRERR